MNKSYEKKLNKIIKRHKETLITCGFSSLDIDLFESIIKNAFIDGYIFRLKEQIDENMQEGTRSD